jgi:large subunit ribosomal protein L13
MHTFVPKESEIQREWFVVDADGKVLGRMASRIANVLRGKNKPIFSPHLDAGDHVIVVNAEKVSVTGRKRERKTYYRHTGYPGGLKATLFSEMIQSKPEEVIRLAVKGMLPKNKLGRAVIKKLKIYAGPTHPHEAQGPKPLV